jgi:methionyl-tRNA formyltransferase
VDIASTDTAVTLRDKLVAAGLDLQDDLIRALAAGPVTPTPQTGEPTLAPTLKKEDGRVVWGRSARETNDWIRGTYEWPGATTRLKGVRLKLRGAEPRAGGYGRPGTLISVEKGRGFLVKCGDGSLLVTRVQPEGKREMDAESFWNGARLSLGDMFESPESFQANNGGL